MIHRTIEELESGLESVLAAPRDEGIIELIVRRPAVDDREILEEAELSVSEGLVGDSWSSRSSSRTPDGSPHPDMQLTLMSSRLIALLVTERAEWALAGDQLFVDLDLGHENLPAGTRLSLGSAEIEITEQPHTGCKKFAERFGLGALKFVNSAEGRAMRLRGVNARVVRSGNVKVGDVVRRA